MKTMVCALAQLRPDLQHQIAAQLRADENLLACYESRDVELRGAKSAFAYAITPRQIVQAWANPRLRQAGAYALSLHEIITVGQGASRKTGFEVWLRTHTDASMRLYFETEALAEAFADTLRAALHQAQAARDSTLPSAHALKL